MPQPLSNARADCKNYRQLRKVNRPCAPDDCVRRDDRMRRSIRAFAVTKRKQALLIGVGKLYKLITHGLTKRLKLLAQ